MVGCHLYAVQALDARRDALSSSVRVRQTQQGVLRYRYDRRPEQAEAVLERVDDLRRSFREDHAPRDLLDHLDTYDARIRALRRALLRRGLDAASGIEGRFRREIHRAERLVRAEGASALLVPLLVARRGEKDFLLRRKQVYIDRVRDAVAQLRGLATTLDPPVGPEVLSSVEGYEAGFLELVVLLRQIDALAGGTEVAAFRLTSAVDGWVERASARAEWLSRLAVLGLGLEGLALILLALVASQLIVTPIRRMQAAATAIAAGRLADGLEPRGGPDLRALARALMEVASYVRERKAMTVKLEAERERALAGEHAKGRFLATMSHEVRTPLNAIIGTASLMKDRSPRTGDVDRILSAGEHLLALIDNILDFSRLDHDAERYQAQPTCMEHLTHEVEAIVRPLADLAGLSFELETRGLAGPPVLVDPVLLRQVLVNLLGNAVKFTEEGSVRWTVTAEPISSTQRKLRFSVRDTGPGIRPEDRERLLLPFERATPGQGAPGTGLGLAISNQLIQRMGGALEMASTVGVGSEFAFSIRVDLGGPDDVMSRTCSLGAGEALPQWRVLLADDNPINQEVIGAMLDELGLETVLASDGAEALARAEEEAFEVILMDLSMPVMNGSEVVERIRQGTGPSREAAIICVTAHGFEDDRRCCLASGADGFLTKPLRLAELQEALQQLRPT